MSTFSLNDHQLGVAEVHHNLPPSSFYEQPRKTQLPPSWLSSVCIEKGQSRCKLSVFPLIVNRN